MLITSVFVIGTLVAAAYLNRTTLRFVYLTTKIPQLSLWETVTVHVKEVLSDGLLNYCCKRCYALSYKPFGHWLLTGFVYIVSDPDTMDQVYASKHLCNKTEKVYGILADYAGRSSFVLNGDRWKLHRKIANPAFRKTILESNMHVTVKGAEDLVEKLTEIADGSSVDISEMIEDHLFDVTARFYSTNHFRFPNTRQFSKALAHIYDFAIITFTNPIYHWFLMTFDASTRKAERDTRSTLAVSKPAFLKEMDRVKTLLKNDPDRVPRDASECIVQMNSKMGDILDDQELYEEAVQLVAAAAEPIATAMKAALLLLSLHQDVQQRVLQEIQDLFQMCHEKPTPKDFENMEYLNMVVKETLRLFPLGCIIGRTADEETELNGTTIPKGCIVLLNIMALHRNPRCFQDPFKFIPERFSPDLTEKRHPFAYIPFSYGPRACLGQVHAVNSVRVLLCYIVRAFKILPGDGIQCVDDIKVRMNVTLQVNGPMRFIVRNRKDMTVAF